MTEAATKLTMPKLPEVSAAMLEVGEFFDLPQDILVPDSYYLNDDRWSKQIDFSLTSQIPRLMSSCPEAVLFTANSAIPVADSIRGVYEAVGQPTPLMGFIKTKGWESNRRECKRLKRFLGDITQVCIVDEYVASGSTCERARILLNKIGVTQTSVIMGRWYHQAEDEIVKFDFNKVSSSFAKTMHQIGVSAVSLAKI